MKNLIKVASYLLSCNIATFIIVIASIIQRQTTSEGVPLLLDIWLLFVIIELPMAVIVMATLDNVVKIICLGFVQGLLLKYVSGAVFHIAKSIPINISAMFLIVAVLIVSCVISFLIPYIGVRYIWKRKPWADHGNAH